jgi:hypothetical protein
MSFFKSYNNNDHNKIKFSNFCLFDQDLNGSSSSIQEIKFDFLPVFGTDNLATGCTKNEEIKNLGIDMETNFEQSASFLDAKKKLRMAFSWPNYEFSKLCNKKYFYFLLFNNMKLKIIFKTIRKV